MAVRNRNYFTDQFNKKISGVGLKLISADFDKFKLLKELQDARESKGVFNHKLFYCDIECSQNWINLVESVEYELGTQSTTMLAACVELIINKIFDDIKSPFDLVNLGVGNGKDDLILLPRIVKLLTQKKIKKPNIVYFPLDISYDLIIYSLMNLKNSKQNILEYITPVLLHDDFFQLHKYKALFDKSDNPKLFVLLGSTLSNYDESALTNEISDTMNERDYLLLGVDCALDKLGHKKLIESYSKPVGYNFLLGPLRSLEALKSIVHSKTGEDSSFRFTKFQKAKIKPNISKDHKSSVLDGVVTVIHELTLGNDKHQEKIKLNQTHKYKKKDLLEFLSTRFIIMPESFTPTDKTLKDKGVSKYKECNYNLILLKKKPSFFTKAATKNSVEVSLREVQSG